MVRVLMSSVCQPFGETERPMAKAMPAALAFTDNKARHDIGQQPEFTRRTFREGRAQ